MKFDNQFDNQKAMISNCYQILKSHTFPVTVSTQQMRCKITAQLPSLFLKILGLTATMPV